MAFKFLVFDYNAMLLSVGPFQFTCMNIVGKCDGSESPSFHYHGALLDTEEVSCVHVCNECKTLGLIRMTRFCN